MVSGFLLAAAYEFWRDRHERLNARWPLIVLLGLHGGLSAAGALEAMIGGFAEGAPTAMVIWLQFVHFETLAFIIGTSIFTVAMAREKSEMQHRIAASTDALTGVATRRAFYDVAESILAGSRENHAPFAVIVFDLDGFKSINDTYGHGRGDDVLRVFGRVASKTLRTTDLKALDVYAINQTIGRNSFVLYTPAYGATTRTPKAATGPSTAFSRRPTAPSTRPSAMAAIASRSPTRCRPAAARQGSSRSASPSAGGAASHDAGDSKTSVNMRSCSWT